MVLLEEVVAAAKEVDSLHSMAWSIREEMRASRVAFRERLDPLEKRMKDLGEVILDYLVANDLPAVKLGTTLFFQDSPQSFVSREEKIEDILKTTPAGAQPDILSKKIVSVLKKRVPVKTGEGGGRPPLPVDRKNLRLGIKK